MSDPASNKWLGLLRWSMNYQDGTSPSEFNEIKPEDKAWLERVMKEGVMDEAERMVHLIRIFNGEDPNVVFGTKPDTDADAESEPKSEDEIATPDDLEDYKQVLLDELLTRVDQIDNAQTFCKLKGLVPLLALLQTHPRPTTRGLAAQVFATVVQNNPPCQVAGQALNASTTLLTCLSTEEDSVCRARILSALSCLIRNDATAELAFITQGMTTLTACVTDAACTTLQRKALFLLRYLVTSEKSYAMHMQAQGTFPLEALRALVATSEDVELRENALWSLLSFGQGCDAAVRDMMGIPAFVSTLVSHVSSLRLLTEEAAEDVVEELEATETLLVLLIE